MMEILMQDWNPQGQAQIFFFAFFSKTRRRYRRLSQRENIDEG